VVREKLTEPSCKRENKKLSCMSVPPDALLVEAIKAGRKEDIVSADAIEALKWHPNWLEGRKVRGACYQSRGPRRELKVNGQGQAIVVQRSWAQATAHHRIDMRVRSKPQGLLSADTSTSF
jgi:hypothetical protein